MSLLGRKKKREYEKVVEEVDELLKILENELKEKIKVLWRREYWMKYLSNEMGIDKKNGKNIFILDVERFIKKKKIL
jgi:hypothetical protein